MIPGGDLEFMRISVVRVFGSRCGWSRSDWSVGWRGEGRPFDVAARMRITQSIL